MPEPLRIKTLALDTSTPRGSVALLCGIEVAGELRISSLETHSARLLRSIEFLLGTVGWKLEDVGLFAAGIGPGSFTGIRIGLATALGLAQSLGRPLAPVSGLDAVAHQTSFLEGVVGVVLDAQRSQVYYAEYACGAGRIHQARRPGLWYPSDLAGELAGRRMYLAGEANLVIGGLDVNDGAAWPRWVPTDRFLAAPIGRLAVSRKRRWRSGEFVTAEPLYIRPPDARKPKRSKH